MIPIFSHIFRKEAIVMPSRSERATTRRHFSALIIILVFLISAAIVRGQGGVGSTRGLPTSTGGINTIQGRVVFPDSGSKRVRVKLDSINFVSQSSQTDDDGVFHFNSLEAGAYTITVDAGNEYETAVERVNIDREASRGGRFVNVPIFLKLKPYSSIPQPAIDAYRKGQESARGGNHKKAAEQFSNALVIYPNFTQAMSELGLQYLNLNQMDKAAEMFTALLKLTPKDSATQLNLGISLFNLKKFAEAESHFRESLNLNSKMPTTHYYLGMTLVTLKRYDEAQQELELAISNGGENLAQAHRYLGGLYMSAHRNKDAADELEKYLKLEPKAADVERIKGTIKELRSKQ